MKKFILITIIILALSCVLSLIGSLTGVTSFLEYKPKLVTETYINESDETTKTIVFIGTSKTNDFKDLTLILDYYDTTDENKITTTTSNKIVASQLNDEKVVVTINEKEIEYTTKKYKDEYIFYFKTTNTQINAKIGAKIVLTTKEDKIFTSNYVVAKVVTE